MKNTKKKGFTIVELVIVIAVIAILAAVAIPTFSNVITKAKESKALQEATNAYKEVLADALADDGVVGEKDIKAKNGYTFTMNADGTLVDGTFDGNGYTFTVEKGVIKSAKLATKPATATESK